MSNSSLTNDKISNKLEESQNYLSQKSNNITFIDRKKSKPVLTESYNKLLKYLIYLNYKEEKITFRIIYDKIYRPDLYNFIIKGSEKNINLTRNIFTINEDKYPYETLKQNEDLNFDDDEMYNENNYLLTVHKYYLIHKLTIYLSLPLCLMTLYYKFVQNHSTKVFVSMISLVTLFGVNWNNKNNQKIFGKKEISRMAFEANRKYVDIYKNFFYDL